MAIGALLIALLRRQPPALLAASVFGWIALLVLDRMLILPAICGGASTGFELTLAVTPPGVLVLAWFAMLLAMMSPLLAGPIAHVRLRSFKRRRFRSLALFLTGYGAVWFAAAPLLVAAAYAIRLLAQAIALPAFVVAAVIVLIWQAAPIKQICLNRCHRLPRLSAFGPEADVDCLCYGLATGVWCVGTCWGLMLLPLVADHLHLPVMAAVAMVALIERARLARPARWGFAVRLSLPAPLVPIRR